ncbi:MAG: hypothetical protein EHM93_11795 [Bacteroidales bacterium]|nr:MAG: hypothetical protein EHM93_11795 [Bacteroidales bacterium]
MRKIFIISILFAASSTISFSQDCNEFFNYSKYANCNKCIKANYKIYLQPKHKMVQINDTLTYNVLFYGGRDYMISFCADQKYYPLHIRLLNPETRKVLYDNVKDYYLESIGVGVFNTQNLIIEVVMKAENPSYKNVNSTEKVCLGMILQWKKLISKSNKLHLKYKRPS